jgi:hypothetical protein
MRMKTLVCECGCGDDNDSGGGGDSNGGCGVESSGNGGCCDESNGNGGCGDGLLVLLNHKKSGFAHLMFGADVTLLDMVTGEIITGAAGGTARVKVGDMQVRIFKTILNT